MLEDCSPLWLLAALWKRLRGDLQGGIEQAERLLGYKVVPS